MHKRRVSRGGENVFLQQAIRPGGRARGQGTTWGHPPRAFGVLWESPLLILLNRSAAARAVSRQIRFRKTSRMRT